MFISLYISSFHFLLRVFMLINCDNCSRCSVSNHFYYSLENNKKGKPEVKDIIVRSSRASRSSKSKQLFTESLRFSKSKKDHKMKNPLQKKNSNENNSTLSRFLCENTIFSNNRAFRKAIEAIKLDKPKGNTKVLKNKLL